MRASGSGSFPDIETRSPQADIVLSAGKKLREIRYRLGLTLRDVEDSSAALAEARGIEEFVTNPSRLSDIETKGVMPSIYRLYVLSLIYRTPLTDLLDFYGIDLRAAGTDFAVPSPTKTSIVQMPPEAEEVRIPVKLDPSFDSRTTANLGRMIQHWGVVPLRYVYEFSRGNYTYGYVGSEDMTMYPLLLPGSFVQVDESRTKVEEGMWRSEHERPIYFVETRDGYVCCWCSMKKTEIILQPHPLSPVHARILKHPSEAEVLGQVVGVAMRLDHRSVSAAAGKQGNSESTEGEPKEARRP